MNKLVYLIVFLILTCGLYGQEYWIHKPSPVNVWLTNIYFTDTLFGWAGGEYGKIIHTSTGGGQWIEQNSGIDTFVIEDIFFLNRRMGWAVTNNYYTFRPIILSTTNSGNNWVITYFTDTTQALQTIYFLDSLTGYLGAFTGPIYKTTNGGSSWQECLFDTLFCPIFSGFPKYNFYFLNYNTGFACGGLIDLQGIIWKTTNGGLNWFNFCLAPEPLKAIKAVNPVRIISTGGDYDFGASTCESSDSGNNWHYNFLNIWGEGRALAFRTPAELWIPLAHAQTWALSLDSGKASSPWMTLDCPDSTSVYDAVFVTPSFGWACGTNGAVLQYNSQIIGIYETGTIIPEGNILFQNYPNPFNPVTTISYNLSKISFVVITIYDIQGKEVRKYIEGNQTAGIHKFRFNSGGLSSGVYFYRIKAGDYVQSKKMIILK